ncbi:MAG: glycosyltransferase [Herpetosiphonaceae bacterium]|nr:glycosyltransferase [Herpetosiphonaceae bacterium]
MKLCVVGPTYPFRGGIAHYTTLLVKHLREAGHITRFYSYTRQYPRWLFPGKSDRDPSIAPLRVDCEYVLDPINPLTWWSLCRKIRSDAPDVVILQWWVPYWTPSLSMIGRWVKQHTHARIIFICHNVVPHDGGGVIDRRLAMTVLRYGDAFLVHSEQDRHRLKALLPAAQIIKAQHPTYAALATHTSKLTVSDIRQEFQLPADRPILLFFGLVRPYKGLEYLIQALPLVLAELPVHLLVVGEFWVAPTFYTHYAEEYKVQDAVTLVNRYVPNEDLRAYFDLSDVVVLPYISATQSGVLQLAFGFGKTVITTRVGGLHEVVQDGITGMIVPPQDEVALAEAIIKYFRHNLRPLLERNVAAAHDLHSFSWQQLVTNIEQVSKVLPT